MNILTLVLTLIPYIIGNICPYGNYCDRAWVTVYGNKSIDVIDELCHKYEICAYYLRFDLQCNCQLLSGLLKLGRNKPYLTGKQIVEYECLLEQIMKQTYEKPCEQKAVVGDEFYRVPAIMPLGETSGYNYYMFDEGSIFINRTYLADDLYHTIVTKDEFENMRVAAYDDPEIFAKHKNAKKLTYEGVYVNIGKDESLIVSNVYKTTQKYAHIFYAYNLTYEFLKQEITRLTGVVNEKDKEIMRLNGVVNEKDKEIIRLNGVIIKKTEEISYFNITIAKINIMLRSAEFEITSLRKDLSDKSETIKILNRRIIDTDMSAKNTIYISIGAAVGGTVFVLLLTLIVLLILRCIYKRSHGKDDKTTSEKNKLLEKIIGY